MATAGRFVVRNLRMRRSSSSVVSVANMKMVDVITTPIPILMPYRLNLKLGYSSGGRLSTLSGILRFVQECERDGPEYLQKVAQKACSQDPEVAAYARFAVEEFNKRENAQLQFVRGLCPASVDRDGRVYLLKLEALDADHGLKTYQTKVKVFPNGKYPPKLRFCGLWDFNEPNSVEG